MQIALSTACLQVALSRHAGVVASRLLLGEVRKWIRSAAKSQFDPERTSGLLSD
jgi:hypothetical protein